jgi:uncharacterized delta-60 repeat protein
MRFFASMRGWQRTRRIAVLAMASSAALSTPSAASPGDLDPSFGVRGVAIAHLDTRTTGRLVTAQPDGSILAAGVTGSALQCSHVGCIWPNSEAVIVRFSPDGSRDPGFGEGGVARLPSLGNDPFLIGLATAADGDVTLVSSGGLARLDAHGQPVPTFHPPSISIQSAAVGAPNGGVILAGNNPTPDYRPFEVRRLLPDGSLDASFAGDGQAELTFSGLPLLNAVGADNDGSTIVAVNEIKPPPDHGDAVVLRKLQPDGTPDLSFGSGGELRISSLSGMVSDVEVQPDGGALVSAYPYIFRVTPGGELDSEFGNGGFIIANPGQLAVLDDGSFATSGSGVALFGPNGSPATGFGSGGHVAIPWLSQSDLAIDEAGQIVTVGQAFPPADTIASTPDYASSDLVVAAHTMAPGPPDLDADGVTDASDPCPVARETGADGCASIARSFATRVSHSNLVHFKVLASDARCVQSAFAISTQRRTAGARWRTTGERPMLEKGVLELRRPGRYRLAMGTDLAPDAGRCPGAKSEKFHVRRSPGHKSEH